MLPGPELQIIEKTPKGGKQPPPPKVKNDVVHMVHTRRPIPRPQAHLGPETVQRFLEDGKRIKLGKRTFYRDANNDKAVYHLSDQVFVVGSISAVQHFVRDQGRGQDNHPLHAAFQAAAKHDVVVAVNQRGYVTPLTQWFLDARTVVILVDDSRDPPLEATMTVELHYANADLAEQTKKLLDAQKDKMPNAQVEGKPAQVIGSMVSAESHARGRDGVGFLSTKWRFVALAIHPDLPIQKR
jgi:hypothetical protein